MSLSVSLFGVSTKQWSVELTSFLLCLPSFSFFSVFLSSSSSVIYKVTKKSVNNNCKPTLFINPTQVLFFSFFVIQLHSSTAWFSEPDRTRRSDRENQEPRWKLVFKPKEPDFLLIPWTTKTGVGPHEPMRTVQSNPLAIFFIKKKLTQFYST